MLRRALGSIPPSAKAPKSSGLLLTQTINRRSYCSSDNIRHANSAKRTPSKPQVSDISLVLKSPQVSNCKRQPLTARNLEAQKLQEIYAIINEKHADERLMIKRIREVFAFQGIREEEEQDFI